MEANQYPPLKDPELIAKLCEMVSTAMHLLRESEGRLAQLEEKLAELSGDGEAGTQ